MRRARGSRWVEHDSGRGTRGRDAARPTAVGLSTREVAELAGIEPGTLRAYVSRVRAGAAAVGAVRA